jgi:hypothetical protein
MGEIRQMFEKKKNILFVFKGYTCRFKSEAFVSFASIALRPEKRGEYPKLLPRKNIAQTERGC